MAENSELNIVQRLTAIMGEIESLKNDAKHAKQNWTFATINAFYDAVRPLMAKYEVIIIPKMLDTYRGGGEGESSTGKPATLTSAKFEMFITSDGVAGITAPWESESIDFSDKGINQCASFAVKYFLKSLFLISTSDDEDENTDKDFTSYKKSNTTPNKNQNSSNANAITDGQNKFLYRIFKELNIVEKDKHAFFKSVTNIQIKSIKEVDKDGAGEFISALWDNDTKAFKDGVEDRAAAWLEKRNAPKETPTGDEAMKQAQEMGVSKGVAA